MNVKIKGLFTEILINKNLVPTWSNKIKRWSQLDEASFAIGQSVYENLEYLKQDFDQIIFITSQGSNLTDWHFVHDEKISPSHFVHTLPNVRSVVFSTLTGWEGPMYCLSQGENSLVNFLNEAFHIHSKQKTLIINLNKNKEIYQADFYFMSLDLPSATHLLVKEKSVENNLLINDKLFRSNFLKNVEFNITEQLGLRKIK